MNLVRSPLSFGSGVDNPNGLQLDLVFDEDTRTVYGEHRCNQSLQGNDEGDVHPGVLCVVLDEVMQKINESMNFDATVGEITIRYLQSAKIQEQLHLRGWFVKKNRRTIENRAEVENEIGKIIARGKGKYTEKGDD